MNKEKLKHYCVLPLYQVDVEKKINPDKSCHKVYWEWVDASGKKNKVPPIFKHGTWKLFVDVITAEKVVNSYETGENDEAWNKLLIAAEGQGFKDTVSNTDKTNCTINLQNGELKIIARKVATDDGWSPEVKFIYSDKDNLIKTSFWVSLDNVKNLDDIAKVFSELAKTFN